LSWCREKGLPEEWFRLGLWRWRRLPGEAKKFASRMGVDASNIVKKLASLRDVEVVLTVRPCEDIYEAQGSLKEPIDLAKAATMLKCTGGRVLVNEKLGLLTLRIDEGVVSLNKKGSFSIRAEDTHELKKAVEVFVKCLLRAKYCNSCGSCKNWCPTNSIVVERGVEIKDSCLGCRTCISACPVATYMYKSSTSIAGDEVEG
jgi:phosphoadenosine phosphosulfate reductase